MRWVKGQFGLLTRSNSTCSGDRGDPLGDFYDQMISCAIIMSLMVLIQGFGIYWWKRVVNAKYYKQQASRVTRGPPFDVAELGIDLLPVEVDKDQSLATAQMEPGLACISSATAEEGEAGTASVATVTSDMVAVAEVATVAVAMAVVATENVAEAEPTEPPIRHLKSGSSSTGPLVAEAEPPEPPPRRLKTKSSSSRPLVAEAEPPEPPPRRLNKPGSSSTGPLDPRVVRNSLIDGQGESKTLAKTAADDGLTAQSVISAVFERIDESTIVEAFAKADTDNSGFIEISEMRRLLRDVDSTMTESELLAVFAACDTSDDGRITLVELLRAKNKASAYIRHQSSHDEAAPPTPTRRRRSNKGAHAEIRAPSPPPRRRKTQVSAPETPPPSPPEVNGEAASDTTCGPASNRTLKRQDTLTTSLANSSAVEGELRKFIPFPRSLVAPHVPIFAFGILLTGCVESSVAVLASKQAQECGASRLWPAATVLVFVFVILCLLFAKILHLYMRHRSSLWQPAENLALTDAEKKVQDPLLKYVQVSFYMSVGLNGAVDRSRGEFVRPDDEIEEPARTERLLAKPIDLFPTTSADALDQLGSYVARSSGGSIFGIMFDLSALVIQVAIVTLTGIFDSLDAGSSAAHAQVVAILCLQVAFCVLTFTANPAMDRFDGVLTAIQFGLEGTALALLLASKEKAAFGVLLVALLAPVGVILYDGIATKIIAMNSQGEKVGCKACLENLWAVGIAAYNVTFTLMGINPPGGSAIDTLDATVAEEGELCEALGTQVTKSFTASLPARGKLSIRRANPRPSVNTESDSDTDLGWI